MPGGQFLQLNVPNAGDGVGLNNQLIPVGRGGADIGLGIELVPGAQPRGYPSSPGSWSWSFPCL